MINRRLLRIKVLQVLYSFHCGGEGSLPEAEKTLLHSVAAHFGLQCLLLRLPLALADVDRETRARRQRVLHPRVGSGAVPSSGRGLDENGVICALRSNEHLASYRPIDGIDWRDADALVAQLYSALEEQPFFQEYVQAADGVSRWEDELRFADELYSWFEGLETLREAVEDVDGWLSVDLDTVLHTIRGQLQRGGQESLSNRVLIVDELEKADRDFALRLLGLSVLQKEQALATVARFTRGWEMERLAVMDMLILQMAVTESVNFSDIPRRVTINEYIELAHLFCSLSSPSFVNGILDNLTQALVREGAIQKTGIGLQGE